MDLISISAAEALAFVQVVFVDLVLAGDNAVVVGMAVAGLPREQRGRAMLLGIGAATVMRILFASVTVQLLEIIGLTLAGGLLLLWVTWKLWREIETARRARRGACGPERTAAGPGPARDSEPGSSSASSAPTKTLRQAAIQIVVADLSMSLDNVLAVAGIARDHAWVLVFGLGLSVLFMGLAAMLIAKLLARFHWIAYVGLALIFYVAVRMILEGGAEVVRAATLVAWGGF